MRIPALRVVAVVATALLVIPAPAGAASADTVTTRTGQQLSINVAGILAQGRVVAHGRARISSGPTTITAVEVSFDDHEEIPVGVDAQGRFEVDTSWPDATSVTIRATVTASDGSTATAVSGGRPPATTRPPTKHRHLADTGAPGPSVLGPLGLLLVLVGIRLVSWGRDVSPPDPLEDDRILGL